MTSKVADKKVALALSSGGARGFAYIGAYFALIFLRFMSVKLGFSGFSYYCWGAALFAFILYMI
jgi:hypothetical protein